MRRVLVLVLVALAAGGCERSETTERPPVPADARVIDDCPRVADSARRLAVLDQWRAHLLATKRQRSPVEAPLAFTQAYIDLELGYAYARLDNKVRANELRASSAGLLEKDAATDPVHGYLLALYERRIADAIGCRPATAPTPELEPRYAALDRVARYKVDRLLEQSRVLARRTIDAIGAFSRRGRGAFGDQFEALRTVTDGAERVRSLGTILDQVPGPGLDRNRILAGALETIAELPTARGKPLLARVISLLPSVKPEWELWARALITASAIDDETVRFLVQGIANLDREDAALVDQILMMVVRPLKARPAILRSLLATQPKRDTGRWLGLAAAYVAVGNYTAAKPLLEAGHTRPDEKMTTTNRHDILRALVQAYSFAPVDLGLPGIQRLFDDYKAVTDSFGTNSHYNLSAIGFNSVIVLGIAGE